MVIVAVNTFGGGDGCLCHATFVERREGAVRQQLRGCFRRLICPSRALCEFLRLPIAHLRLARYTRAPE